MTDLHEVLDSIETSKVKEYFSRPLPDAIDNALVECLRRYDAASDEDRQQMRSLVNAGHSYGLLAFAERMAVLGVRERSEDGIYLGLLAITLENFRLDAREDIMIMALLLNSTRKIGSDPVALFDSATSKAEKEVAEAMRSFVQARKDDKKVVQIMG